MLTGMKLVQAFPQQVGYVMELIGGYFAQSAADQFLFDSPQVERATDHFVFGQEAFLKDLEFDGAGRLEAGPAFAVPGDKGGFGYAKAGGNASKAEALGAEFNELSFGFGRVHELVAG